MGPGRPTTANTCRQELAVLVSGKPMVIACQKAGGHPGMHSAPVKWLPRAAIPPPGRKA